MTRKLLSISTMGLIDFQSDKERTARSARLTKQATRKQNRLIKKQTRRQKQQHRDLMAQQRAAVPQQPVVSAPLAAGWYPDVQYPGYVRWWDGVRWTDAVRPAS
jgi:hypothetical protein